MYRSSHGSFAKEKIFDVGVKSSVIRARVLGLAQRLAYQVSGATRAVLARSALKFDGRDDLRLILPDDGTAPRGAAVERRFQALATALRAGRATIEG